MTFNISLETNRSTIRRLDGLVISVCAARVRSSGEPGPEPTSVIRPPVSGWILGGRPFRWGCCRGGGDDDCWPLLMSGNDSSM